MLGRAQLLSMVDASGDFFHTTTELKERRSGSESEGWRYRFGGKSWLNTGGIYITETLPGYQVISENTGQNALTNYRLFLEARNRTPLRVDRHNEALRMTADWQKRWLLKTCTTFALDTTFKYKLRGPKKAAIRRSAHWSIIGIRPDLRDKIQLVGGKFDPIRDPSPMENCVWFGPKEESDSWSVSSAAHKRGERILAISFDQVRIEDMLNVMEQSAI